MSGVLAVKLDSDFWLLRRRTKTKCFAQRLSLSFWAATLGSDGFGSVSSLGVNPMCLVLVSKVFSKLFVLRFKGIRNKWYQSSIRSKGDLGFMGVVEKARESLLDKSLPNKLCIKEKFFGYKVDQSKSLEENLDEFQKIIVYLNNIGEKMLDENEAVILFNSLPETYREIKAAIKYGRDSLTMSIVLDALKTRNLEIKKERKDGELLMARGRSDKNSWKGKEKSSKMNSKGEARKCFFCHKGHFKKHCPLNKSKKASSSKHANSEANVTDGYGSGYDLVEVLMVSHWDIQNARIMDSGCTYHMTPNQDFLINFQKSDGGKVLLDRLGHTIKFKNRFMKVTKGYVVKPRGILRNGLYVLEGIAVSGSATKALEQQKQQTVDHVVTEVRIDGVQSSGKGSNVSSDQSLLVSQTGDT
ncbi:Retrovirus-related Pol polyprotein from transposon TNT 1-94 [Cucumis melo var. makuwa]|uniref:Retrovirus-related Pol polyprotein from transposon TNT 1-94 n=1 Tax=Cucumis melo var. makuwa TaxID=1194695 RepID=A0A5D3DKX3_CUCMM|nr:Retrovirus-related Pol polyprotein from transposon TNT 1-94 [Cucumis melo var. makuwa]TYK24276.1 Retrovirus-related Pol polyprotein from transposon TNT 1-94 [Cucumis melo var. makuwa]